jgi:ABC-2 type transport system permease protein
VSSRVKTFHEAYQIGGIVVLPVVLLILGQASGVVYLSVPIVFALGMIFWLIDLLLLWIGIRSFRRAELIAKL